MTNWSLQNTSIFTYWKLFTVTEGGLGNTDMVSGKDKSLQKMNLKKKNLKNPQQDIMQLNWVAVVRNKIQVNPFFYDF